MAGSSYYINPQNIDAYKIEFEQTKCVYLPGFVSNMALQSLVKKLEQTPFETKYETEEANKFGKVLFVPQKNPVIFAFHLLFNNTQLFNQLQQITGCAKIENFVGRVHRSEEGGDHAIAWHGDNADNRLLAMTVGLGNEKYTGANFELRETATQKTLRQFGQIPAGDAFVFAIAPGLQHRLTTLDTGRRTVGVGWYRALPEYNTFIKSFFTPV